MECLAALERAARLLSVLTCGRGVFEKVVGGVNSRKPRGTFTSASGGSGSRRGSSACASRLRPARKLDGLHVLLARARCVAVTGLLHLGAPSSSKDPVESDDEVTAGVDGRADGAADKRPRWLTVESLRQVLRVALNAIAAAVSLVAAEMSAPTAVAVERKSWGVAGGGTKDGSTDFVCLSSQAVEGLGEWVWRELRRRWTALIGAARYDADAADALARTAAACVRHEPQLSAQLLHSSGGAASHHADGLYYGPSPLCDLLGAALASMQMLVELTKVRLRQQLKCTNLVCSSSGCNWQG